MAPLAHLLVVTRGQKSKSDRGQRLVHSELEPAGPPVPWTGLVPERALEKEHQNEQG